MRRIGPSIALAICSASATMAQEVRVSHGPILGRVSSDGIGIWARTNRSGRFRVRYGTEANKLDRASPSVSTEVEHDNTGWIHITGLNPGTRYHYQVVAGEAKEGPGGTFRTLPTAEKYRDPELNPRGLFNFDFEFACGNNQDIAHGIGPSLPTFATMNRRIADEIDFAILNGDWMYEELREYPPEKWFAQVGVAKGQAPPVVKHAPTIVGVWENYKLYLSRGKNLADWHRRVPSFFTFDDHEILNDVWGAGTPGLRDRRAVFRDIGVQAWYDYLGWSNPVSFTQGIRMGRASLEAGSDVLTDPRADFSNLDLDQAATLHVHWGGPTAGINDNDLDGVGGDPNAGVYEIARVLGKDRLKIRPTPKRAGEVTYSIGRRSYYRFSIANCDFFLLDTRTHREMHDTRHPDKPGLSMLGKRQKQWLMEGMKQSDADFCFVVSSVNFMVPHVGGGKVRATNKDDAWTVFFDEREQLIRFWDSLDKPVFVLTGDLHNSFAIKITDRVWEFASGPHNSANHLAKDEGGRPANGRFKYGPRACDIRWSTYFPSDVPRESLRHPSYCVVRVNNAFNAPVDLEKERWIAFPKPQVIFRYFDGRTGKLRYSETIVK